MRVPEHGFTLMEVMIALAIVGILATLAVPSFQTRIVRDQIVTAVPLANVAKKPVEAMWAAVQAVPADNQAAGLPAADKIVNNHISAVAVKDGAIHVTFGNNAHDMLKGRVLSLRPAVVDDAPVVPVAWVCGFAPTPGKMSVKGENLTDLPTGVLPYNCMSKSGG